VCPQRLTDVTQPGRRLLQYPRAVVDAAMRKFDMIHAYPPTMTVFAQV